MAEDGRSRARVYLLWFLIYLVIFYAYFFMTKFEKTIHVRQEILLGEPRGAINLVENTETRELYRIHNTWLLLHFNAAELSALMEEGGTYKIKGYGVRIPFLGLYPCILDATLVG